MCLQRNEGPGSKESESLWITPLFLDRSIFVKRSIEEYPFIFNSYINMCLPDMGHYLAIS